MDRNQQFASAQVVRHFTLPTHGYACMASVSWSSNGTQQDKRPVSRIILPLSSGAPM